MWGFVLRPTDFSSHSYGRTHRSTVSLGRVAVTRPWGTDGSNRTLQ